MSSLSSLSLQMRIALAWNKLRARVQLPSQCRLAGAITRLYVNRGHAAHRLNGISLLHLDQLHQLPACRVKNGTVTLIGWLHCQQSRLYVEDSPHRPLASLLGELFRSSARTSGLPITWRRTATAPLQTNSGRATAMRQPMAASLIGGRVHHGDLHKPFATVPIRHLADREHCT